MSETCLNCNNPVIENFCSNCGQKKYKRIDKKYIWDEIQYTVFHTNKGLLFSVKNILKNPGKTAKEFIDGNYNSILEYSKLKNIEISLLLKSWGKFIPGYKNNHGITKNRI